MINNKNGFHYGLNVKPTYFWHQTGGIFFSFLPFGMKNNLEGLVSW